MPGLSYHPVHLVGGQDAQELRRVLPGAQGQSRGVTQMASIDIVRFMGKPMAAHDLRWTADNQIADDRVRGGLEVMNDLFERALEQVADDQTLTKMDSTEWVDVQA